MHGAVWCLGFWFNKNILEFSKYRIEFAYRLVLKIRNTFLFRGRGKRLLHDVCTNTEHVRYDMTQHTYTFVKHATILSSLFPLTFESGSGTYHNSSIGVDLCIKKTMTGLAQLEPATQPLRPRTAWPAAPQLQTFISSSPHVFIPVILVHQWFSQKEKTCRTTTVKGVDLCFIVRSCQQCVHLCIRSRPKSTCKTV